MTARKNGTEAIHERMGTRLRDPREIVAFSEGIAEPDPRLLDHRADRAFWKLLSALKLRLLVTREYEHLAFSIAAPSGRPDVTYASIPHPSGLAADRRTGGFHLACTRNPNLLMEIRPAAEGPGQGFLVPRRARFLPGRLYLHDLALIGGRLFGNAVGENAVVRLSYDGPPERAWWPRCIERRGRPGFGRNVLQLNSIAAGRGLSGSYFTASCARPGRRVPGDPDFEVDGRGVLFSGRTREPVADGLTRPHSARLQGGRVWLANSGYGELVTLRDRRFVTAVRLPGWTRGLALAGDLAFVGTSPVLRRFAAYAPGLDLDRCVCGVHAVELTTGRVLGSITWPAGNQIFAVEAVPQNSSRGFPAPTRELFYSALAE